MKVLEGINMDIPKKNSRLLSLALIVLSLSTKLWASKHIYFVDLVLGRSILAVAVGAFFLYKSLGISPFGEIFEQSIFVILIKAILSSAAFVIFMFKMHVSALALFILLIMVNPLWTSIMAKFNENQSIKGFEYAGIVMNIIGLIIISCFKDRSGL
jgi:hypothetical protein